MCLVIFFSQHIRRVYVYGTLTQVMVHAVKWRPAWWVTEISRMKMSGCQLQGVCVCMCVSIANMAKHILTNKKNWVAIWKKIDKILTKYFLCGGTFLFESYKVKSNVSEKPSEEKLQLQVEAFSSLVQILDSLEPRYALKEPTHICTVWLEFKTL